jgi:hypothetical protein
VVLLEVVDDDDVLDEVELVVELVEDDVVELEVHEVEEEVVELVEVE